MAADIKYDVAQITEILYGVRNDVVAYIDLLDNTQRQLWVPWVWLSGGMSGDEKSTWSYPDAEGNVSVSEDIPVEHCELKLASELLKLVGGEYSIGGKGGKGGKQKNEAAETWPVFLVADPLNSAVSIVWNPKKLDALDKILSLWKEQIIPRSIYEFEITLDRVTSIPAINLLIASSSEDADPDWSQSAYRKFNSFREEIRLEYGGAFPQLSLRWVENKKDDPQQFALKALLVDHGPSPDWSHDKLGLDLRYPDWSGRTPELEDWVDKYSVKNTRTSLGSLSALCGIFSTPASRDSGNTRETISKSNGGYLPAELLEASLSVRRWHGSKLRLPMSPITLISADNASGKTTLVEGLHQVFFGLPRPRLELPAQSLVWRNQMFSGPTEQPPGIDIILAQPDTNVTDKTLKDNLHRSMVAIFGSDIDTVLEDSGELSMSVLLSADPSRTLELVWQPMQAILIAENILSEHVDLRDIVAFENRSKLVLQSCLNQIAEEKDDVELHAGFTTHEKVYTWVREFLRVNLKDINQKLVERDEDDNPIQASTEDRDEYNRLLAVQQRFERHGKILSQSVDVVADLTAAYIRKAHAENLNAVSTIDVANSLVSLLSEKTKSSKPGNFVTDAAILSIMHELLDSRKNIALYVKSRTNKATTSTGFLLFQKQLVEYLSPTQDSVQHEPNSKNTLRKNTAALVQFGQAERLARHLYFSDNAWRPLLLEDVTIGQDVSGAARTIYKYLCISRKQSSAYFCRRFEAEDKVDVVNRNWTDQSETVAGNFEPFWQEGSPQPFIQNNFAAAPQCAAATAQLIATSYQVRAIELAASATGITTNSIRMELRKLIPAFFRDRIRNSILRLIYIYSGILDPEDSDNPDDLWVGIDLDKVDDSEVASVPQSIIRLKWGVIHELLWQCILAAEKPVEPEDNPTTKSGKYEIPGKDAIVKSLQDMLDSIKSQFGLRLLFVIKERVRRFSVDPELLKGSSSNDNLVGAYHYTVMALLDWMAANDLIPCLFADEDYHFSSNALSTVLLSASNRTVETIGPRRVSRIPPFCQKLAPITECSPVAGWYLEKFSVLTAESVRKETHDIHRSANRHIEAVLDESEKETESTQESNIQSDSPVQVETRVENNPLDQQGRVEQPPKHDQVVERQSQGAEMTHQNSVDSEPEQISETESVTNLESEKKSEEESRSVSESETQAETEKGQKQELKPKADNVVAESGKTLRFRVCSRPFDALSMDRTADLQSVLPSALDPAFGQQARAELLQPFSCALNKALAGTHYLSQPAIQLETPLHNSIAMAMGHQLNYRRIKKLATWQGQTNKSRGILWDLDRSNESNKLMQTTQIQLRAFSHRPVTGFDHSRQELSFLLSISNSVYAAWEQWCDDENIFNPRFVEVNIGERRVESGAHAVAIADQAAQQIIAHRSMSCPAVRLFMNCPVSVALALGRTLRGIGTIKVMEFDSDKARYRQVLVIDA